MVRVTGTYGSRRCRVALALAAILVIALLAGLTCSLKPERSLVLATTTSTYDSGLLDFIIPAFEELHNTKVRIVAVGTGQALALGSRGDADVVLVHAPRLEEEFITDGFGIQRTYVMYNDFVIIGPEADPAGINGLRDGPEAFRRIASTRSTFASRGDESGTHVKERGIWAMAGVHLPESESWYLSLGQGMGGTLTAANEKGAYTLIDRGTFLSRGELDLVLLTEGDERLFNPYHAMIVNPDKFSNVQVELAQMLIEFLVSNETQERIGEFGYDRFGQSLFTPVNLDSSDE